MELSSSEQHSQRRHIALRWIENFNAAIANVDHQRCLQLFTPDCYWRDLLSLTWDIRTYEGGEAVVAAIGEHRLRSGMGALRLAQQEPSASKLGDHEVIEAFFEFEVESGLGRGVVRLRADHDEPATFRAWTFLTTLQQLKGFRPATGRDRPTGAAHDPHRTAENWLDARATARSFASGDPEVLVVGAGQAGLALAARLGALGVTTLVVDRLERVGDNWRNRYHSLRLHNQITVNHMPYLKFPETWPAFIPKDMLAQFFEFYADALEINVWTKTECRSGHFDEADRRWTVELAMADGTTRTMRPRVVVMAIGISGIPSVPSIPGAGSHSGTVVHSSAYDKHLPAAGRTALVVGAGNSAHDIAQDLYLRGAEVTMLQRGTTTVVSVDPTASSLWASYNAGEGVRPLEDIDMSSASVPLALTKKLHKVLTKQMAEDDKELLDGLRSVGFGLDNGEDDTGFFIKSQRYFGGYYLNVGASDLIIEKKIGLRQGVGLDRLEAGRAVFSDGTSQPADLVVFATGYLPLQEAARLIFGEEVAEHVGPIWGLRPDGELRNMWRRTGQEGFFVMGGSFAQCRVYSHYTALQIKALLEGLMSSTVADGEPGASARD